MVQSGTDRCGAGASEKVESKGGRLTRSCGQSWRWRPGRCVALALTES